MQQNWPPTVGKSKTQQLIAILDQIQAEGGTISAKRGPFWKILHYLVVAITFGKNRRFLTDYYTTIGPKIGVPVGWSKYPTNEVIATLTHELEHVKQCKRFGFGNAWVGLPLFGLFYLFLPFPIGFAYFRWRFERAAYVIGINRALELVDPSYRTDRRHHLIKNATWQLTSGAYAWTWPFPKRVKAYLEQEIAP